MHSDASNETDFQQAAASGAVHSSPLQLQHGNFDRHKGMPLASVSYISCLIRASLLACTLEIFQTQCILCNLTAYHTLWRHV